jgi:hypothetical protein
MAADFVMINNRLPYLINNRLPYLVVLLLLCLGQAVSAQQREKSLNYGFVSPNTKENLKLDDAIEGMRSAEETKLLKQSINMGCVVHSRVRAFRALGSWSDGAEHSVMLRVESDEPAVRYLLSRLGRDARQKSILYFHPQPAGTADLYTLQPRRPMRNLAALANTLERAGIVFRTIVPLKSGTWIYIVDLKRELRAKVMAAAKRLGARVRSESGTAAFVGDDQVQQAQVVFNQEIQNYETRNPNLPPACDVQPPQKRHKTH